MINQRFRNLRKSLGLSQTEFGKKLGVTRSVILNIELNKVVPKDVFVHHTCEVLNVNREWLVNGAGEIFRPEPKPVKAFEELWHLFNALNPEFKDYVFHQIYKLLEIQGKNHIRPII